MNTKGNKIKKTSLSLQTIIPDSELGLYQNPEVLATFKQGLKEAKEGKLSEINFPRPYGRGIELGNINN